MTLLRPWHKAFPIYQGLLGALALAFFCLRFIYLADAPPGLYVDEALPAVHALCLNQTAHDLRGQPVGPFQAALQAGITSPPPFTYIQPLRAWVNAFGATAQSVRLFSAIVGVFLLIGIYLLTKRMFPRSEILALILICISPWAFHFYRVAWEVVIYPTALVWFLYFLFGQRKFDLLGTALLAFFFYFSYPAARLLLPALILFFAILRGFSSATLNRANLIVAALSYLLAATLLQLQGDPALLRYEFIAEDLTNAFQDRGLIDGIVTFSLGVVGRYFLHLDPTFLFARGDLNLRHNSGYLGLLSWPEIIACFLGLLLLVSNFFKQSRACLHSVGETRSASYGFIILLVVILLSVVPAALTTEGVPHVLRSSAAWPLFSILAAAVITRLWQQQVVALAIVLSAYFYGALFLSDYFWIYPNLAEASFDATRMERAQSLPLSEFLFLEQETNDLVKAYYTMTYYGDSCLEARARFDLD
jgi:hypothetical protein